MSNFKISYSIKYLFLLLILSQFKPTLNACSWSGMNETFFNSGNTWRYGRSSGSPLTIAWVGDGGAIWLSRRVLFGPRFEINLNVWINAGACSRPEWWIGGFAIMMSKNVGLNSWGDTLGYNGFTNTIVTEIDLFQNTGFGDISSNSISIHQCWGSTLCVPNESGSTVQRNLNFAYSKCANMNYRVRILYNNGRYEVNVNGVSYVTIDLDVQRLMGSWGFVGFSGFYEGKARDMRIEGSSVCETVAIAPLQYYFNWNNVILTDAVVATGSSTLVFLAFQDSTNLRIPHINNSVWGYSLTLTTTCGTLTAPATFDDFYFRSTHSNCLVPGSYSITTATNRGVSTIPIRVLAAGFQRITFPADLLITTDTTTNYSMFKWGTLNGDFSFDALGGFIRFDIFTRDNWDNLVDLGTDLAVVKSRLNLVPTAPSGAPPNWSVVSRVSLGLYTIQIDVAFAGTYTMTSTFLRNTFAFYVYPGRPSVERSTCTISNFSSTPTVDSEVTVSFTCTLYDQGGNLISPNINSSHYGLSFGCDVNRLTPASETTLLKANNSSRVFQCDYITVKNGSYVFKPWMMLVNGSKTAFSSIFNNFIVQPTPKTIETANVFNYLTNSFGSPTTHITFVPSASSVTALDLFDVDGTSFSNIGYSSAFNLANFKGTLFNVHDPSFNVGQLNFNFITINNRRYIGVFLNNAPNFITRSSHPFRINISYLETNFSVQLINPIGDTNGRPACVHPLSLPNTLWNPVNRSGLSVTVNTDVIVGSIILQTNDNFLYNYRIDRNLFSATVTPTNLSTRVYVVPDINYDGAYLLRFFTQVAGRYSISLSIDKTVIFTTPAIVNAAPEPFVVTLNADKYNSYDTSRSRSPVFYISKVYTNDDTPVFNFDGFDQFNNLVNLVPSSTNNFFGIKISLSVNGRLLAPNTILLGYDTEKNTLRITDTTRIVGNYEVTLTSQTNQPLSFIYAKRPGAYSPQTSSAYLLGSDSIKINANSTVAIDLRDQYGVSISADTAMYNELISKITVKAQTSDTGFDYKYLNLNSASSIYWLQMTTQGIYSIVAQINNVNGSILKIPCTKCSFVVSYDAFDIDNCKMSALTSSIIPMSQNSMLQINNQFDRPLFNFYFFDSGGKAVQYVDPKTPISATVTGNNFSVTMNSQWISTNNLLWTFPETVNLKDIVSGNYVLNIYLVDMATPKQKYSLQMLGDGQDSDAGNGAYNLDLTFFSATTVNSVAGVNVNFNIEFRTADNLRWNNYGDVSLFAFTNSLGISDRSRLNFFAQTGAKKGQFIITAFSTISSSAAAPIVLTLTYQGVSIKQTVNLVIANANLSTIIVDPSNFKDAGKRQLLDGTTITVPSFKFRGVDIYGNTVMDIFNPNAYSLDRIVRLFSISHSNGFQVTSTATVNLAERNFSLQIVTRNVGDLYLTSAFMNKGNDIYTINVKSGPINSRFSFASIVTSATTFIAGSKATFKIYPRDLYNNIVLSVTQQEIANASANVAQPNLQTLPLTNGVVDTTDNSIRFETTLTVAGANNFSASYSGVTLSCSNCLMQVSASSIVFSKSVLNLSSAIVPPAPTSQEFKLDVSSVPTFNLSLYDAYGNFIPATTTYPVSVKFTGNSISYNMCSSILNGRYSVTVCQDSSSIRQWTFTLAKPGYLLTIQNGASPIESLTYPIELIGGISDSDASNGPIDQSRTHFSSTSVTTVAGVYNQFTIELRTTDGLRKNFWYDIPYDNIKISFSKGNLTNYAVNVIYGSKPGQYTIQIMSRQSFTASENNRVSVTIENVLVTSATVQFIVTPAQAVSALFYDLNDKLLSPANMPVGTADSPYVFKFITYDEFRNVADTQSNEISFLITPPSTKSNVQIQSSLTKNPDLSFTLRIQTIFAGTYSLSGKLWPSASINVRPGVPDAANSFASVKNEANAGEVVSLYIVPHDANNNYIDPNTIPFTANPFSVSYNYMIKNSYVAFIPINSFKIDTYTDPTTNRKFNAFVYSQSLIYRFQNQFNVVLNNTTQIKCLNCMTNVIPGPMVFSNNLLMRYDPESASFVEMGSNVLENNTKYDIIHRIYPRDQYGNVLDTITNLSSYTMVLIDQSSVTYTMYRNNVDDGKQQYVEFVKLDDPKLKPSPLINQNISYNTLTGGKYNVIYSDGSVNISRVITLAGSPDDAFASNQEIEVQNTFINQSKLTLTADDTGFIIVELRTKNNLRKNNWGNYVITLEPSIPDPTFKFQQRQAGTLGVFFITVSTQKANTFPVEVPTTIKVYVDGVLVTALNPRLVVSPAKMNKAFISAESMKPNSQSELISGNADTLLTFQVYGQDKFKNRTPYDVDTLGLRVLDQNGNPVAVSFVINQSNGIVSYTAETRLMGNYSFTANSNDDGSPYFDSKYVYYNNFGALNIKNTEIVLNNQRIIAGNNAVLEITPRDSFGNNISTNVVKSVFDVTVTAPNSQVFTTQTTESNGKLIYTANLTIRNLNQWVVKLNNNMIPCSGCSTLVIPDVPFPENSVVTSTNTAGIITVFPNTSTLSANNAVPIILYLSLRDRFQNPIDTVDQTLASVSNVIMSGNDMTPIEFDIRVSADNSQFILTIPADKVKSYNHLVSNPSYSLNITVNSIAASKIMNSFTFNYVLRLSSNINDQGYGNGIYVVDRTYVSHSSVTLFAGSTATINVRLKTIKGLYYNNDIKTPEAFNFRISQTDSTFKFNVYKRGTNYSDYNIDITSTYVQPTSNIQLTILIEDPTQPGKFVPIPTLVTVIVRPKLPPAKDLTQVVPPPTSLSAGSLLTVTFKLFDEFKNPYFRNNDIVNLYQLTVINNGIRIANPQVSLGVDGLTYQVSFIPSYPPRTCNVDIIYNDGSNTTSILKSLITTNIISEVNWKNSVVSGLNAYNMKAGNKLKLNVYLFDSRNICVDTDFNGGAIPIVARVTGPVEATLDSQKINFTYNFELVVNKNAPECQNYYSVIVPDDRIYNRIGTYSIVVTGGPSQIVLQQFTQILEPDVIDPTKFVSLYTMAGTFNPGNIIAGTEVSFTIRGNDKFGNQVNVNLGPLVTINVRSLDNRPLNKDPNDLDYISALYDNQKGILNGNILIRKSGTYVVQYFYDKVELTRIDNTRGPNMMTVNPGLCSAKYPIVDVSLLQGLRTSTPTSFTITCRDSFNNRISVGGARFVIFMSVTVAFSSTTEIKTKINDNNDGTYKVEFTPPLAGVYQSTITLGNDNYKTLDQFVVSDFTCPADKPFTCSNSELCVANTIECISPKNDCPPETPFSCSVAGTQKCVKSMTECDCPSGYVKCRMTNTCVMGSSTSVCPFAIPINCSQFAGSPFLCPDGICRRSREECSSQPVCPYGFLLCPDLSCRSSYSNCTSYENCPSDRIKCSDQSCVTNQALCPTIVTCPKPGMFVCPDRECVDNELNCKNLTKCTSDNPYLCPNNTCVASVSNCPKSVACGQGKALCSDLICRDKCTV